MSDFKRTVVPDKGIIAQIRNNLGDRYKNRFSIIQELLQNADDAGATSVHFGLINPVPVDNLNDHSLAKCKGLYVVNNGPVTKENSNAIHNVGLGTKSTAVNQIGRFGLGMKSVYHVCDAFFLCSKGNQDVPSVDFCMPPWPSPHHEDWVTQWTRQDEDGEQQLFKFFSKALPTRVANWERWFGVWLPLRVKNGVEGGGYPTPYLINEFVDDLNGLFGGEDVQNAVRLLPLLKNVTEISFEEAVYKLEGGRITASNATDMLSDIQGTIKKQEDCVVSYVGRELVFHDDVIDRLMLHNWWPKEPETNERGETSYRPDKTFPHVAVEVLTERCQEGGARIRVVPCGFLPLSDVYDNPDNYGHLMDGTVGVTIFLHAFYFIDAGRKNMDFTNVDGNENTVTDESQLKKLWNRELLRKGVLPLVVEKIAAAAFAHRWSNDLISQVVKYVRDFFSADWQKEAITSQHGFAKVLSENRLEWKKIDSQRRLIGLSFTPGMNLESPLVRRAIFNAFSGNPQGEENGTLVFDTSSPNLVNQFQSSLSADDCRQLLTTVAEWDDNVIGNDPSLESFILGCCYDPELLCARISFGEMPGEVKSMRLWTVSGQRFSYNDLIGNRASLCLDGDHDLWDRFTNAVDCNLLRVGERLNIVLGLGAEVFDTDFVIRRLSGQFQLRNGENGVNARISLLENLLQNVPGENNDFRRVCRYLVHGNRDIWENDASINVCTDDSPSWKWMAAKANVVGLGCEITVPDAVLGGLNANQRQYLDIRDCRTREEKKGLLLDIWRLANGENPLNFQEFFNAGGCWSVIVDDVGGNNITDIDQQTLLYRTALRSLPIFPVVGGGHCALSEECCYYVGADPDDFGVPDILGAHLKILDFNGANNQQAQSVKLLKGPRYKWNHKLCCHHLRLLIENNIVQFNPDVVGEIKRAVLHDLGMAVNQRLLTDVDDDDVRFVVDTPWIEMNDGQVVSLSKVVNEDALPNIPGWYSLGMIHDDHVRQTIMDNGAVLLKFNNHKVQSLFTTLVDNPEYALGELGGIEQGEILQILQHPIHDVLGGNLPIVMVLRILNDQEINCVDYLPGLRREIASADRLINIINSLSERLAVADGDNGNETIVKRFLGAYLNEAVNMHPANFNNDILPRLRLFNADRNLTATQDLYFRCDNNIPEGNCIDEEYYNEVAPDFVRRLHENAVGPGNGNGIVEVGQEGWSSLRDYLLENLGHEYGRLVAGFVIACSSGRDDIDWAGQVVTELGTVETLRDVVSPNLHGFLDRRLGVRDVRASNVNDGDNITVRNIIGTEHNFQIANILEAETLFNGIANPIAAVNGGNELHLRMRVISEETRRLVTAERALDLLKRTLNYIFRNHFAETLGNYDLNGYWGKIAQLDQVSVSVTGKLLLGEIGSYLGAIGYHSPGVGDPLIRQCNRLKAIRAEVASNRPVDFQDVNLNDGFGVNLKRLLRESWGIESEIDNVIRTDPNIQNNLLCALRERMRNYGYSKGSLLFELFQNADDSLEELVKVFRQENNRKQFVVRLEGHGANQCLTIVHWGRPINRPRDGYPGFGRDLEKMIRMFQSDKQQVQQGPTPEVTGKFGLGFKTVFLVSDMPIVYSGNLRFKIVGGVLPVELNNDENGQYLQIYNRYSVIGREPTVIILPIRDGEVGAVRCIIEEFRTQIAFLLAFSKQINEVTIELPEE